MTTFIDVMNYIEQCRNDKELKAITNMAYGIRSILYGKTIGGEVLDNELKKKPLMKKLFGGDKNGERDTKKIEHIWTDG